MLDKHLLRAIYIGATAAIIQIEYVKIQELFRKNNYNKLGGTKGQYIGSQDTQCHFH